jgi:hypothetical protein
MSLQYGPRSAFVTAPEVAKATSDRRKAGFIRVLKNYVLRPKTFMKKTIVILLLLVGVAFAKHRKDIPQAPLPAVIANAKTVFLTNGGGSNLAYDAFYSDMKQWGKYEIVGSPDNADLIIELAYRVEHNGTDVWSATNSYTGKTQVYSSQNIDPQLALKIYDAKSKNSLWSAIDHRQLARREKNREKETIKSADRLVDQLKTRVAIPQ